MKQVPLEVALGPDMVRKPQMTLTVERYSYVKEEQKVWSLVSESQKSSPTLNQLCALGNLVNFSHANLLLY